jgi:hypothetical protein
MISKLVLGTVAGAAALAIAALLAFSGGHEARAGVTTVTLDPATDSNPVGTDHTVTATTENWPAGEILEFEITDGPNAGATLTCTPNANCSTDGSFQASATYTSNGTAGTDTIQACTTPLQPNALGEFVPVCDTATKEWVDPTPTATATAAPTPTATAAAQEISGFGDLGSGPDDGSGFPWALATLLGLGGIAVVTLGLVLRKRPR